LLERIEGESFGLFCPGPADVFVGRETFKGLEPLGEVVGADEVGEVAAQLVVGVVVEALAAIRPLLEARKAVEQQVSELDRTVMKLARHDAQVRQFMTVPGVGATTS
jgi:transposase